MSLKKMRALVFTVLLVCLVVLGGCGGKKSDGGQSEQAAQEEKNENPDEGKSGSEQSIRVNEKGDIILPEVR